MQHYNVEKLVSKEDKVNYLTISYGTHKKTGFWLNCALESRVKNILFCFDKRDEYGEILALCKPITQNINFILIYWMKYVRQSKIYIYICNIHGQCIEW